MTRDRLLPICLLSLILLPLSAHARWEEKLYNPAPLPDDVILPMPCDGAMAFRKVSIPLSQPLDDYAITLGQESDGWGYLEQSRAEHIAGSFADTKGKGRYYLMAKYELTELQYQTLNNAECPVPSNKLRLPQVNISWVDAMNLADRYNQWLRKHAAQALPSEDGAKGFVRLPTETEWEFAARGGLAVSSAAFRDQHFPMPEGMPSYAWHAGSQSANGKLQLTGLLKPNPLGLHDMLGNAAEMAFEPFRLNKLDRPHGAAGGYVVRGGSFLSAQADLRSALRQEEPYYTEAGPNRSKSTGMRLAMVAPALTSRARIKEIEQAWKTLGASQPKSTQANDSQPLKGLSELFGQVKDDALKKQLEQLRGQLRADSQQRDEQRDQAVRSSLQLGAFLCTKLKDDGDFLDRLEGLYSKSCATQDSDGVCARRLEQMQSHRKTLDFMVNYYADTVVDNGTTYGAEQVKPQVEVVRQQMSARQSSNLDHYLQAYWRHLQGYWKNGKVSRNEWLNACQHVD